MNDIVVIAPFEELYTLSKKIIKENFFDNVDVLLGDMNRGLELAEKAIKEGAKIIVSRGGTYKLIKGSFNIPVVEIGITSFDLLRVFKNVKGYKGKIGAIGYGNVIRGCEIIGDILDLDLLKIEVDWDENVKEIVNPYIEKGIKIFIGDTIANRLKEIPNIKSYVIKSGEESVLAAINEARRALELMQAEKERAEQLKTITDFVHDGIISIDEKERIVLINNTAKALFNLDDSIIGDRVQDVVPNTRLHEVLRTGQAQIGELQDIGKAKITTNRIPIVVDGKIKGVVATFNDVTELQRLERNIRIKLSKKGFLAKYSFDDIIYSSDLMERTIKRAKMYSPYDSPILIMGRTGVGKELFAQSIHNYSDRSSRPFVAINCAALPPSLIESELFGYVEGAFTGANRKGKAGLFELAHSGTIFLDEISELPLKLQGRLLRVLQEKEVMRIGDDKVIPIDVRIICATNRDLMKLVKEGKFREDLYYRINILSLRIPSLNERKEDIETLAKFFLKKYAEKYNKRIEEIDEDLLAYLRQYDYRGNVRELEGIIERAVVLATGRKLGLSNIKLSHRNTPVEGDKAREDKIFLVHEDLSLEELNKSYIRHVLEQNNGSVSETARVLGISRSTIWRKLKDDAN